VIIIIIIIITNNNNKCSCGSQVDASGTHVLACKQSSGRTVRHHHINDLVWHSLLRAGIPSSKEPSGLSRSDGKRPDGITLIPWQAGKTLMWDVTVADTLANFYFSITSQHSGGASKSASRRKEAKYAELTRTYSFVPIACETLGPISTKAVEFLSDVGRHIAAVTGDAREGSFLFEHISIAIQRFNCICFKLSVIIPPDAKS